MNTDHNDILGDDAAEPTGRSSRRSEVSRLFAAAFGGDWRAEAALHLLAIHESDRPVLRSGP